MFEIFYRILDFQIKENKLSVTRKSTFSNKPMNQIYNILNFFKGRSAEQKYARNILQLWSVISMRTANCYYIIICPLWVERQEIEEWTTHTRILFLYISRLQTYMRHRRRVWKWTIPNSLLYDSADRKKNNWW